MNVKKKIRDLETKIKMNEENKKGVVVIDATTELEYATKRYQYMIKNPSPEIFIWRRFISPDKKLDNDLQDNISIDSSLSLEEATKIYNTQIRNGRCVGKVNKIVTTKDQV